MAFGASEKLKLQKNIGETCGGNEKKGLKF